MGKTHFQPYLIACLILAIRSVSGQTVISDSTYNPGDWSVTVVTTFDASEMHTQNLTGGNPDAYRYMEHILPAPPGPGDLTTVQVTHIYNGDAYLALDSVHYINYSEDIRLLSLPWDQAFIRSYPAIRQSGNLFRASSQYLTVIGDTMWTAGTLQGLTANDFIALDGSGEKPDFSNQGAFLYFGFWRVSSRGTTLPPFPPDEDLIYQHGSDNFTVTIHNASTENQRPVALKDEYLYLDYFSNSDKTLYVLRNDFDPEGDPIHISNVDSIAAFGGTIESFTDSTITYSHEGLLSEDLASDFFLYRIMDNLQESLDAFVSIYFCLCPLECIQLFLAEPPDDAAKINDATDEEQRQGGDSLDLDLFRRFRDEVLLPDETGSGFVDLYYHYAPEVMPLLLIQHRDLGRQAFNALGLMQVPISSLLDGDGSAMISQELIDSVDFFIDRLMGVASDSLRDALDTEIAQLCPLQELVGLTVSQAMQEVVCDTMNTAVIEQGNMQPQNIILRQNFPNPFSAGQTTPAKGDGTQISYSLPKSTDVLLQIYDIHGHRIRTLVDAFQLSGEHYAFWDGIDDQGNLMHHGLYLYQLIAGEFRSTKVMIFLQ